MPVGECLLLQTHVKDTLAFRRVITQRYKITPPYKDNTVLIPLEEKLNAALNAEVFGLYERLQSGTHVQPVYYDKAGKHYVPAIAVKPTDGCSYQVYVAAQRDEQWVTAYHINCVADNFCEMIAMVTDDLSLSPNFNGVSELDLWDVVNILQAAKIVRD